MTTGSMTTSSPRRATALGTIYYVLQLRCRYLIAYQMFSYASAKLLGFPKVGERLRWVRPVLVPVLFAGAFAFIYTIKQQFMPPTPVDGVWDFTGGSRVSRLYFDGFGACVMRMADRLTYSGECAVDAESRTVSIDIKQISQADIEQLYAEGKIDETTDAATFARPTRDSPTAFRFSGSYRLVDEDTLVLEPQGGGQPVQLTRAEYAYGDLTRPFFRPFLGSLRLMTPLSSAPARTDWPPRLTWCSEVSRSRCSSSRVRRAAQAALKETFGVQIAR